MDETRWLGSMPRKAIENNNMKETIVPPFLKKGDRIAIAAPARKITAAELEPAVNLFQSWGLETVLPDHLFDTCHQFAGDDTTRAALLQQLLDDPTVKAIVCARGGYGTVRIVDRIDFARFAGCPKWVVGYSDITVLHSHIHRHTGIATLHATMPIDIPADSVEKKYDSTETMRRMLFGKSVQHTTPCHPLSRDGAAEGQLVGGNLSILYSLCGSASDLDTEGKILFIEDLDEYLYHIDRMMMNLKRSGHLSGIAGLVVGALSGMHDNTVPFGHTAEEIVRDTVAEYGFPVAFGFAAGHIGTANRALMLGQRVRLSVAGGGGRLVAC